MLGSRSNAMSVPDLDTIFKQYGDWWCRTKAAGVTG